MGVSAPAPPPSSPAPCRGTLPASGVLLCPAVWWVLVRPPRSVHHYINSRGNVKSRGKRGPARGALVGADLRAKCLRSGWPASAIPTPTPSAGARNACPLSLNRGRLPGDTSNKGAKARRYSAECPCLRRRAFRAKLGSPGGPLARWGKDEQGSGRSFRHSWRKRSPAYFARTPSPRMPPSALRGGSFARFSGLLTSSARNIPTLRLPSFVPQGVTSNKGACRPPCVWSFQGGGS